MWGNFPDEIHLYGAYRDESGCICKYLYRLHVVGMPVCDNYNVNILGGERKL